jgi:hypothetical protein
MVQRNPFWVATSKHFYFRHFKGYGPRLLVCKLPFVYLFLLLFKWDGSTNSGMARILWPVAIVPLVFLVIGGIKTIELHAVVMMVMSIPKTVVFFCAVQ